MKKYNNKKLWNQKIKSFYNKECIQLDRCEKRKYAKGKATGTSSLREKSVNHTICQHITKWERSCVTCVVNFFIVEITIEINT